MGTDPDDVVAVPDLTPKDIHYHEAGHAVAAHRLNVFFLEVNAIPDVTDDRAGGVLWKDMSPLRLAFGGDMTRRRLQVILAGPVAEAIFTTKSFATIWKSATTGSDRKDVEDIARALAVHTRTEDELADAVAAQLQPVEELILANKESVEAVAQALAAEGVLTATRVAQIVDDVRLRTEG